MSTWQSLTRDPNILSIVSGYKLEFVNNVPLQWTAPQPINFSEDEAVAVDKTVTSLLGKGVIKTSKHEVGELVHNVFVRPKKDGTDYRMILNLKAQKRIVYVYQEKKVF